MMRKKFVEAYQELPVGYSISYFTAGERSYEIWPGSFEEAKAMATQAVENGTAERSEIRDADKQLLFHYPRTLKRG